LRLNRKQFIHLHKLRVPLNWMPLLMINGLRFLRNAARSWCPFIRRFLRNAARSWCLFILLVCSRS